MNVPKLRFKEFTDEWIHTTLGESTKFKQGIQIDVKKQKNEPFHNSIRFIRIVDYTQNTKDIRYIEIPKNANIVNEKDIVMVRYGATAGYTGHGIKGVIANNMFTITPNSKIDKTFLFHILKQEKIYKRLNTSNGSSAMPALNFGIVSILKFCYPSIYEQRKISNLINLLDKKIELQTKKIEALKLFKKGLINYLFSQNIAMKITVKDLGTIITGTTPSKENNFFWDNGNIPWITPSDITYERDISNSMVKLTEDGLLNGRYLPKDSILVTCIASIGKNAVLKVNGSCNQQINAIIPNEKFNHNYIYYLMEYMSNYMKSIAGTSATSIINKSDFEKLNINVHSITEQIKIDKILSSIEEKEKLENQYLYNITKLKTYLLQNMFI